jgi:hypothetical protein
LGEWAIVEVVRLERAEPVVRMYGLLGLAWLQRQAELAEQLVQARGQTFPLLRRRCGYLPGSSRRSRAFAGGG